MKNLSELCLTQAEVFPFIYGVDQLSTSVSADGTKVVYLHQDVEGCDKMQVFKIQQMQHGEFRFIEADDKSAAIPDPIGQDELSEYMIGLEGPEGYDQKQTGWALVNGLSVVDGRFKDYRGLAPAFLRNILTGATVATEQV